MTGGFDGTVTDELDLIRGRLQRLSAPRPVRVEQGEPLGPRTALPEGFIGAAVAWAEPKLIGRPAGVCLLDVREIIRGAGPR